jgi:hypothetical protein
VHKSKKKVSQAVHQGWDNNTNRYECSLDHVKEEVSESRIDSEEATNSNTNSSSTHLSINCAQSLSGRASAHSGAPLTALVPTANTNRRDGLRYVAFRGERIIMVQPEGNSSNAFSGG